MEKIIEKHLEGDIEATKYLVERIERLHNYSITNEEALVLVYTKYGKPKIIRQYS